MLNPALAALIPVIGFLAAASNRAPSPAPGPATPVVAPAAPAFDAVVASVGGSEWGPPGEVTLDLDSGRYLLTAAPPPARSTVRPILPIREGKVDPENLRALRNAYDAALSEGLVDSSCGPGGEPPPGRIVIGGGWAHVLVLVGRAGNSSPPRKTDCWSASARALANRLNAIFRLEAGPRLAVDPPLPPLTGPAPHAIFASVGQSEWGPAGRVALDLRTGDYWLTPAPPPLHALGRLDLRIRQGRLETRTLGLVRAAEAAARKQGMANTRCLVRPRPRGEMRDAAEPLYLLLTDRAATIGAPYRQECHTPAAAALADLLERLFGRAARPYG